MIEAQQIPIRTMQVYSPVTTVTSISYEQYSAQQAQPLTVQVQQYQVVIGVIMGIWLAAFVLQQVIKVFKGEEVERPPLIR